jgi:hypothetical protein
VPGVSTLGGVEGDLSSEKSLDIHRKWWMYAEAKNHALFALFCPLKGVLATISQHPPKKTAVHQPLLTIYLSPFRN